MARQPHLSGKVWYRESFLTLGACQSEPVPVRWLHSFLLVPMCKNVHINAAAHRQCAAS